MTLRFWTLPFFVAMVCIICGCRTASDESVSPNVRAAWMSQVRWGVMTHYLADWREQTDGVPMNVTNWNDLVNNFDVDGLADQIKSTGASYHILTIGQGSGYYDCPNRTYDRFTQAKPSKCSQRDL